MTTVNEEMLTTTGETATFTTTRNEDVDETLYRYINTHDSDVTVTVEVTDYQDPNFEFAEEVVSGKTVASGGAESDYITEPWTRLRFTFELQNGSMSGTIELREIHKE